MFQTVQILCVKVKKKILIGYEKLNLVLDSNFVHALNSVSGITIFAFQVETQVIDKRISAPDFRNAILKKCVSGSENLKCFYIINQI